MLVMSTISLLFDTDTQVNVGIFLCGKVCYNSGMKSYKTDMKNLIQVLDVIAEPYGIEYKACYEYRYDKIRKRCHVKRKIIVFHNDSPIKTEWFKGELEMIQYISEQLAQYPQK